MTDTPTTHPLSPRLREAAGKWAVLEDAADELDRQAAELVRLRAEVEALREDLRYAEAALADIGDADRETGDDLAWCERRAAKALPRVRAAIDAARAEGRSDA